jgi:F-type H+-transporting ATPase subunit b
MSINIWTFLFEIVNFLVLALILQRLLYRPLHQALDRRREQIEQAKAAAEAAREQAAAVQEQLAARLAAMEEQRRQVLAAAHTQALAERAQIAAETEQEMRSHREDADKALAQQRQEAQEQLRVDMVALALDLAARLLRDACDADMQRQLAHRLIEALRQLPDSDRATLYASRQPRSGAILETAHDLDDVTLADLNAAIATLIGEPVPLTVMVKPALLGGLRLLLSGQVWDASLAGHLEEARHAESATPV